MYLRIVLQFKADTNNNIFISNSKKLFQKNQPCDLIFGRENKKKEYSRYDVHVLTCKVNMVWFKIFLSLSPPLSPPLSHPLSFSLSLSIYIYSYVSTFLYRYKYIGKDIYFHRYLLVLSSH